MTSAGVLADTVVVKPLTATGQAFIWVSAAGENSIVVAGGANLALSAEDISPATLKAATVVLAQLETPVATLEAAFIAAGPSVLRILNAAPALPDGQRLFPLIDILIVNETELARYAGLESIPEGLADLATAARRLTVRPDQVVIVTLGKDGAAAFTADGPLVMPGRQAKVVDTTGAGDCFCGVLAARLSLGAGLPEALAWANAAAALSTQSFGAVPSMPTETEIARAMGGLNRP